MWNYDPVAAVANLSDLSIHLHSFASLIRQEIDFKVYGSGVSISGREALAEFGD